MKKIANYILIVLGVNLATYFLLIPYLQQMTNSHINLAPLFGKMYFVLAGIILLVSITKFKKFKNRIELYFVIPVLITFVIWGWQMHEIYCMNCAVC